MLDLHTHLLPGIDDGPADAEESVKLAAEMARRGVRGVAATPHCRSDHPDVVPAELAGRCADLERLLGEKRIRLRVLPAGEVDLVWGLEASPEDLKLVSFCQRGSDLLLETPYGPLTSNFEHLAFELAVRGFRLLLAHPERNPTFQREPERLAELVERGALLQVTASSLARSPRGSESAALAHKLVRGGLAHVIASDAHGPAVPGRATLVEGALAAARIVGEARARWMVRDAPAAIAAGEPLPEAPPADPPKRGLLKRLTGG